jgi:DNA-binding LacI/PurR family transcriptional regulator
MRFVAGIATKARSYDHDVLLVTQDEGPAGLSRVSGGALVDALIVMDVEADDKRLPVLRRLDRPSVLIGLPDAPSGLTCVDLDFTAAGYEAVAHLHQHGHTRIALIGPPAAVYERGTSFATRVLGGFESAAANLGIESTAVACELTFDGASAALARVLDAVPDVTALVIHNEAALGSVLSLLHAAGRSVPRDISIVAICPDDVAVDLPVAVTSIDIPGEQIGGLAVDIVMAILAGGQGAETRLIAPHITERASCAPPASA